MRTIVVAFSIALGACAADAPEPAASPIAVGALRAVGTPSAVAPPPSSATPPQVASSAVVVSAASASASLATVGPATAPPSAAPSSSSTEDDEPGFEQIGALSASEQVIFRVVGRCLENAARAGETTDGSLAVELTISPAGDVTRVSLGPGYGKASRACAEAKLAAVKYPPEDNGGLRVLKYPINEVPYE